MANRQNVRSADVNIYIADTGTDPEDLGNWYDIGWFRRGSAKLFTSELMQEELTQKQKTLAKRFIFEVDALETDYANLLAAESYNNVEVDILLVERHNPLKKTVISKFLYYMAAEYPYSLVKARSLKIECHRVARKMGDFLVELERSVMAMRSWGIIDA
jgi:hypothetical protein